MSIANEKMGHSAVVETAAEITPDLMIPEDLLANLAKLKREIVTNTDLASFSVDFWTLCLAAARQIHTIADQLPAAGLKGAAKKRTGHPSNISKWLWESREGRSLNPDALVTGMGILHSFIEEHRVSVLEHRNAPSTTPETDYPFLWPNYDDIVDVVAYVPQSQLLRIGLKAHGSRKATVRAASLISWSALDIPATPGNSEHAFTKDEIMTQPNLAKLLNAYIRERQTGGGFEKELKRIRAVMVPKYTSREHTHAITYVNIPGKSLNSGQYWSLKYRKLVFQLMCQRVTKATGVLEDLAPSLRPGQLPFSIWLRQEDSEMPKPSETEETFIRTWASSVLSIIDAGLAMEKTKTEIKEVVTAYSNTASRVQNLALSSHERDLQFWSSQDGVRQCKLWIDRPDLRVCIYFSIPMRIHQDRAQSLWQALKRQSQNLWLNGTMFALIIDLISMSAGNIICKLAEIRDSVCVDDLNEDDTFDDTEHTHESTEDKAACAIMLRCHLCDLPFECRLSPWHKKTLCPTHNSMYVGQHVQGRTPLFQSIADNADIPNRGAAEVSDFMQTAVTSLRAECRLWCICLRINGSKGFNRAILKLTDTIRQYNLGVPDGWNPVLTSTREQNGIDKRIWTYRLLQVVDIDFDMDEGVMDMWLANGIEVQKIQAYRSRFHRVVSYDHLAVPKPLIASLDQHRVFFANRICLRTGHTQDNVDVVPRHINYLKHTYPPEWVSFAAMERFKFCILAGLLTTLDAQKLEADATALISAFHKLSLLVPNTRQGRSTAIGNKSLREAVYAAYGPIIEFGRQIGHEDEAYAFYESTADRQPQQVQISGTVEPAKPLVGLRELCQWRAEDYGDQLYRSGTASQAAKFLSSLEGTLKDLQSDLTSMENGELSLVGVHSLISQEFVLFKWWHYFLLLEWCDGYGSCMIAFVFVAFWVVNWTQLIKCRGRCPLFGFRLSARRKDLTAMVDAHRVHGLSMAYSIQQFPDVKSLADLRLDLGNLCVQSRTANYWLHNFAYEDVRLADAQLLRIGHERFRSMYPSLYSILADSKTLEDRLARLSCESIEGFEDGPYNRYWDLEPDHILHPSQGNTHVTM